MGNTKNVMLSKKSAKGHLFYDFIYMSHPGKMNLERQESRLAVT